MFTNTETITISRRAEKKCQVDFSSGLGSIVVSFTYTSSHLTHRRLESPMII